MFSYAIRAARVGVVLAALFGLGSAAQAQAPSASQLKLAQQVVEI